MSKKKEVSKSKPLIGRIGTNLRIGIVGLPNVGKSTFFNILTKSQIPAENFPFCTIDPNESRVPVPDERFDWLCNYHHPASRVPAFLNVMDIAGLVKGAHEGKGLGNAFLSHIKNCDALFNMVRVFEDIDVTHVEGDVNPIRDLEIIFDELRLKDEEYLLKELEKAEKVAARGGDKHLKADFEAMKRFHKHLVEDRRPIRDGDWSDAEIELLNQHLFITAKPIIYLINMSKPDFLKKKNRWLSKIAEWIRQHDSESAAVIPFSAEFELEWSETSAEGRAALQEDHPGLHSCFERIIKTGYQTLQLQYFFTCGKDEVKAWTIQRGTKAPQAAGRIHSDMEKGFIMSEVMSYEDFRELGSENAVKSAGKYKQKGRDYVVEDGDIIFFRFNAGAGLTAAKKK